MTNKLWRGCLLIGCLVMTSAWAQEREALRDFNIAAGTLSQALVELGRQANVLVVAPTPLTAGKTAPELKGRLTLKEALDRLLERSGLESSMDADGSVTIAPAAVRVTQDGSADLRLAQAGAIAVAEGEERGAGNLVGRVTGTDGDSGLTGAIVRILETGQVASTDSLGYFRFAAPPPGALTLSISYIGYAEKLWRVQSGSEQAIDEYRLEKLELAEVTVFGTRSARAKALNLQRAADNSSFVISADTLGNFTGTTISEALRRVPGVAFQRDETTGDGTNIILRGLEPDMNMVKLNGLALPVGDGMNRAASLNNLLADSVDTIVVHHSLLPSMDSAGSGGLVEIETKSPLQRAPRFANFGVEMGRSLGGDFVDDVLGTGTVSGIFGEEGNFGLSASAQYRKRDITNIRYDINSEAGLYLPLERDGTTNIRSIYEVDPRVLFPFEPGADQIYPQSMNTASNSAETSARVATVSADWRVSDATDLRLDIQRAESDTSNFGSGSGLSTNAFRQPLEVVALGEVRQTLLWDELVDISTSSNAYDSRSITDSVSLRGKSSRGRWSHEYVAGFARGTFSGAGLYIGTSSLFGEQTHLDPQLVLPQARDPVQGEIISLFGERTGRGMQLPLLRQAGWDLLNDPERQVLQFGLDSRTGGENDRYTGEWSTRYALERGPLNYLEAGVSFENARFSNDFRFINILPVDFLSPPPIAALGLELTDPGFGAIGFDQPGLNVVSRDGLAGLAARLDTLEESGLISLQEQADDPRLQSAATQEDNLSTYLQTQLTFGKLQIIGGARMNRVAVDAFNLVSPSVILPGGLPDPAFAARHTRLVHDFGTSMDVLPRIHFNYRQSENLVLRASYNLAVARPDISQLSARSDVTLDLANQINPGRETLSVYRGNPELDPAMTHSIDVSMEYYAGEVGLLRVGAFYKHIENLLEFNTSRGVELDPRELDLPDDPYFDDLLADPERLAALVVQVTQPTNNPAAARIWGLESHFERQFASLPGAWSGLGVFANVTYTKSSKELTYNWFSAPILDQNGNIQYDDFGFVLRGPMDFRFSSMRFNEQPDLSGTVALTYNKFDIDATLAYSAQARRQSAGGYYPNGLTVFQEEDSSLDLRIEKRLDLWNHAVHVFLEGSDLLRGTNDPDLQTSVGGERGVRKFYNDGSYFGGRQFRIGVTANL